MLPMVLNQFKHPLTQELADSLYHDFRYNRGFNVGKAIALTQNELKKRNMDTTLETPEDRQRNNPTPNSQTPDPLKQLSTDPIITKSNWFQSELFDTKYH